MKSVMRFFLTAMSLGVSSWSSAQQPAQASTRPLEVINLTLHPSPATRPSGRYKLMPDLVEQRAGNGAPLFLAAGRVGPDAKAADEITGKLGDRFREMSLEKLAEENVGGALNPFSERLALIDIAARREDAVWETTLRDQGANAPLAFLNDMRINARLLSLKARWQIARGDWAGAERTLQTALSMAYQMNNRAVLIQALVEVGIVDLLLDRVAEWTGRSGAPNLYWALTDLPDPFVDLRSVRRWDESMVYFTFPQLAGRLEDVSPAQWRSISVAMERLPSPQDRPPGGFQSALFVASTYPKAKKALIGAGLADEKVNAMPLNQVVGIYLFRQYQTEAEEAWKRWALPYWEGLGKAPASDDEWEMRRKWVSENPFMALIPIVRNARLQFARVDRKIAVLRVIESLRDFASSHDNRLPTSLQELTDLPAPINPVTGKAFSYQSTGDSAILEIEPDYARGPTIVYRLTVAR
jgi:hypothetical protein